MNTTSNYSSTSAMTEHINRNAIKAYHAALFMAQFATKWEFRQWDKDFVFLKIDKMTGDAVIATEWVTPAESSFTYTPVTVTPSQAIDFVVLTDETLRASPFNAVDWASMEVWQKVARTVDAKIQDVVDGGTQVYYSGGAANRAALSTSTVPTVDDYLKAAAKLGNNNVPTFDGYFVAIIHTYAAYELKKATWAGTWTDINKYTDNVSKIFRGEIGAIGGVRFVQSSNIRTYSSSTTVYPSFVIGDNAYGYCDTGDLQAIYKPLGSAGTDDPANQRASIAAKATFGAKLLREEGIVRIESGVSIS